MMHNTWNQNEGMQIPTHLYIYYLKIIHCFRLWAINDHLKTIG